MEKKYLNRIADKILLERLEASGAVLVEGPKWCGKTRTARENSKSVLYMQDPDKASAYLKAADLTGDGTVNSADLLKLRQYLLGQTNINQL